MMNRFSQPDPEHSADGNAPNEDGREPSAYWREQCLLFLLDELDALGTAAFAEQLESSPQLGQYLDEQADMILQVAAKPATATTQRPRSPRHPRLDRIGVALVAIAAVMLAMFYVQRRDHEISEQSTIALAWADSQPSASTDATANLDDDLLEEFELELETPQTDSQIDETLDWMFTALSIETDGIVEESNDG